MAGISLCTEHLICHDSATDGYWLPPRLGCRTRRCSDQGADWRFLFSGRSPSRGVAGSSGSSIRRCPAGAASVRVPPPSLVFVGAARPRLPVALTCSSPMASGAGRLSATCASPSGGCLLGRPGHRRLDRLFLAVELHGLFVRAGRDSFAGRPRRRRFLLPCGNLCLGSAAPFAVRELLTWCFPTIFIFAFAAFAFGVKSKKNRP